MTTTISNNNTQKGATVTEKSSQGSSSVHYTSIHPLSSMMEFPRLGIHGFHETLGIDEDEIFFYWTLTSTDEDALQSAYQVIVCTQPGMATNGIAWDSGIVKSNAQRNIACKPENGFRSTCNYYWKVTVWDHKDGPSYSPIQHFFTAYPRSRRLPPYSMNQTCKFESNQRLA